MAASTGEEIGEAFDTLRAAMSRVCNLTFDALATPERLTYLAHLETIARQMPVPGHALINQLSAQATKAELGGVLRGALADRLRITPADAGRRIAVAEDLGERRALTGQPLPPQLPASAAAQRDGLIGDGHLKVIRSFLTHLPDAVDPGTREAAETDLAHRASRQRPDEVAEYSRLLMLLLHPDGDFSDDERARQRGIVIGEQQCDGMSRISGLITPELRAKIEAAWANLAAPGMNNPDDAVPVVDGEPDEDIVRRDTRTQAQRNHDAFLASFDGLLGSGTLGQHNGLPTTVIVTTTLKDLEAAAGRAVTAGGTVLPMSDVIRMAGRAHHYLAIFDGAKPLALYHTKRVASRAQRIMLLAKDGGCSKPGCHIPGYWTQVHHTNGWAGTGRTDINSLTLACGPHNRLIEESGWTTRTNARGDTEWIPPPHLDHGQPRTNTFHHPEKLLRDGDEDDPQPP